MKLSPKQIEVLMKMSEGWELWYHSSIRDYHSLHHSENATWINVSSGTVTALELRSLIKQLPYQIGKFRTQYLLTDAGKEVIEGLKTK